MERSGRCYSSKELDIRGQKKDQVKRLIRESEAEKFRKKMMPKYYSIVNHMEKIPSQIYLWALLMRSQLHRPTLMKDLDDTYVHVGISSDNAAAMINQVI